MNRLHILGHNSDLLPINRFALKIVAAGNVLIYGKALCEATISICINITHSNIKRNIIGGLFSLFYVVTSIVKVCDHRREDPMAQLVLNYFDLAAHTHSDHRKGGAKINADSYKFIYQFGFVCD